MKKKKKKEEAKEEVCDEESVGKLDQHALQCCFTSPCFIVFLHQKIGLSFKFKHLVVTGVFLSVREHEICFFIFRSFEC